MIATDRTPSQLLQRLIQILPQGTLFERDKYYITHRIFKLFGRYDRPQPNSPEHGAIKFAENQEFGTFSELGAFLRSSHNFTPTDFEYPMLYALHVCLESIFKRNTPASLEFRSIADGNIDTLRYLAYPNSSTRDTHILWLLDGSPGMPRFEWLRWTEEELPHEFAKRVDLHWILALLAHAIPTKKPTALLIRTRCKFWRRMIASKTEKLCKDDILACKYCFSLVQCATRV